MRDLYAVLGEERDGAAVLRLHVNPLAPWIWFGALVMAAGGALSLADRRLRIGAPARRAAAVRAGVACRDRLGTAPSPQPPPARGGGGAEIWHYSPSPCGRGLGGGGLPMTPLQRRALLLAPFGVAALGGTAFWLLLERMREGTYDPHGVPSMLIGKPLPSFSLPGQPPSQGFSSADIAAAGRPTLINFFASWCIPCVQEAPVLMALKQQGTPIWGIAYKDKTDATAGFLHQNGDPYTRIARDEPGNTAIDFGLYGVPETYLIDRSGIVRWRWAGGLSEDIVRQSLAPLLQSLA